MQALLLAAGLGTRLKPLTHHFPKCLTPILGRPLLGIWLEMLVKAGFKKIFINLHHMPEIVFDYVEDTPYADHVEWLHESELLGTAGTLAHFRNKFYRQPLLLVHSDNLSQFPLQSLWQAHLNARPAVDMTMMTFTTDNPSSCGVIERNRAGNIIAFHEKVKNPPGNCANAAVYVLSKNLLDHLDISVSDFSTQVVKENLRVTQSWHNDFCHRDIGTLDSLLRAPDDLIQPLTSPVTVFWQEYWKKSNWEKLYGVANDLASLLDVPVVTQYEIPDQLKAAVVVIEQFNEERWFNCETFLDASHSVIIIGEGYAQDIKTLLTKGKFRYILFCDTFSG